MMRNNHTTPLTQLHQRRDYFEKHFPLQIRGEKFGVGHYKSLKNTCPACGYYTLEGRTVFDICGICFWEDDGQDDFSVNEHSEPNHMTLAEGREIFLKATQQLLYSYYPTDDFRSLLKQKLLILDTLIAANTNHINQVTMLQEEIIEILGKNNIYGLDRLF